MNPDVARFEARRRLAKVWTPAPSPMGVVHVPTIGMMLAEIRWRGWSYIIRHGVDSELCEVEVRRSDEDGNFPASKANSATHEEPAESVTLALAEALEKEAGSDQ